MRRGGRNREPTISKVVLSGTDPYTDARSFVFFNECCGELKGRINGFVPPDIYNERLKVLVTSYLVLQLLCDSRDVSKRVCEWVQATWMPTSNVELNYNHIWEYSICWQPHSVKKMVEAGTSHFVVLDLSSAESRDRSTEVYNSFAGAGTYALLVCFDDPASFDDTQRFKFSSGADVVNFLFAQCQKRKAMAKKGRPFNPVGHSSLVAPVVSLGAPHHHHHHHTGTPLVERLSRTYRDMAAEEHASVASFAAFSLNLLAVGAPLSLVRAAHRAALDELRHAAVALRLASRFSGRTQVPGPLARGTLAVPVSSSVRDLAQATAREACLGETSSVWLMRRDLLSECDPQIIECLSEIVQDEMRHSALGWQTLRWALTVEPQLAQELEGVLRDEPCLLDVQPLTRWLFSSEPEHKLIPLIELTTRPL